MRSETGLLLIEAFMGEEIDSVVIPTRVLGLRDQ